MCQVSVILPTYNRGYIIRDAIYSVLWQTHKELELIIIDDGSEDDTENIVGRIKDDRIVYHRFPSNMGGNKARNIGISLAKYDIIAFLDSDNVWNPCYLETRLNAFGDSDLVFGRVALHFSDIKVEVFPNRTSAELNDIYRLRQCILTGNVVDTNTAIVRKEVIENVLGFSNELKRFQDWELFLKIIFLEGIRVSFQNNCLVMGYRQDDSISKKKSLWWDAGKYVFKKNINHLRTYNKTTETAAWLITSSDRFYEETMNDLRDVLTEEETEKICAVINKNNGFKGNQVRMFLKAFFAQAENGNGIVIKLKEDHVESVVVYGYGELGRLIVDVLKDNGIHISGVVDRSIKENSENDICFFSEYPGDLNEDAVIVSTVTDIPLIKDMIISRSNWKKIYTLYSLLYEEY